jgi:hypothetical protein
MEAVIGALTGSGDKSEVQVMAKQATEVSSIHPPDNLMENVKKIFDGRRCLCSFRFIISVFGFSYQIFTLQHVYCRYAI